MVIHGFRNQQNVPAKNYNCNAKRYAQMAVELCEVWPEGERPLVARNRLREPAVIPECVA
jgi:hypothetical protein